MLYVVSLLLALAAAQDPLTIQGTLKELPADGKQGPALYCEGTANLPNGAILVATLYYDQVDDTRELFRDFSTVKAGAFTQDYPVYLKRIFPGKYVARFVYDVSLQNLGAADFPRTIVDLTCQVGNAADLDRETKAVCQQLSDELRAMVGLGDQVKSKLDELKGKPAADWEPLLRNWRDETIAIQKRADPRSVREYRVLRLDVIADNGFEELQGTLLSAARCAAGGQREVALEGITRLRQSAEKWISDISGPRLTRPGELVSALDEARGLLRKLADNPDQPVLPVRRKFLETTEILDRSIPQGLHEPLLGITSRASAFFIAVADKSADVKKLHAELDDLLQRLTETLRNLK